MKRNIFIQAGKLHNVRGRITYISSTAKQENLYAVYETCERSFWSRLAEQNQKDFAKSGSDGQCIEARELIIALPEELQEYEPNEVLREYTEVFKGKYDTECIAALHHNKRKTNYHIHLIFSERKMLPDPEEKIASRSMFYDEAGKKVRTKKEVTGEDGKLRPGCKVVRKGEVYEVNYFDKKNPKIKSKAFLNEVKELYTDRMNRSLADRDSGYQMQVFDRTGPYLPLKKIDKNNPKEKFIRENNSARMKWNTAASKAIFYDVPAKILIAVKQSEIKSSIAGIRAVSRGDALEKMTNIISKAAVTLNRFVNRALRYQLVKMLEPGNDLFNKLLADSKKTREKDRGRER